MKGSLAGRNVNVIHFVVVRFHFFVYDTLHDCIYPHNKPPFLIKHVSRCSDWKWSFDI